MDVKEPLSYVKLAELGVTWWGNFPPSLPSQLVLPPGPFFLFVVTNPDIVPFVPDSKYVCTDSEQTCNSRNCSGSKKYF